MTVLEEHGWPVTTVDLPTVWATDISSVSLKDDAATVAEAISAIDGPVAVVAHSYGGAPVSQGSTSPLVEHIVFIAAFAIDIGESVIDFRHATPPELWGIDGDSVTLGRTRAERLDILSAEMPFEAARQLESMFRPQSFAAFTEKLTEAAWRTTPSTHIITELDHALSVEAQESFAQRTGGHTVRIRAGHVLFMADPVSIANILETTLTH